MTETTEAVRKSVLVDADPETAFRVFTDQIQSWWPLEKYGIFGEDAEALAFEDSEAGVAAAKAAGLYCIALEGTAEIDRLATADEIVGALDVELMQRLLG